MKAHAFRSVVAQAPDEELTIVTRTSGGHLWRIDVTLRTSTPIY
jgi:hypothetical protein